jgi:hypothetical protein
MITKSIKKHAVAHASHATHATPEPSAVLAPSPPSPEVSAVPPTLAPPATAPMPAITFTPPGDLPPVTAVPVPRAGWEPAPKKKRGSRGLVPKAAQATNANAVAKELTESATYVADFGARAPSAANVAFVVTNAAKWRETWLAARKFMTYAAEQRANWENEALVHMDKLKPAFEYVTSRDPTVAEKYAATSKYLGATNAIAARAATVRKANAKGKGTGSKGNTGSKAAATVATSAPSPAETPGEAVPVVK